MRNFAFIETSPGRVLVGWGPLVDSPCRLVDRPAFYIPDYFRDNPNPWKHPDFVQEMSFDELLKSLWGSWDCPDSPLIDWRPMDFGFYEDLFESAQSLIAAGAFEKVVPVMFEQGELKSSAAQWLRYLLMSARQAKPGLRRYGYVQGDQGFVGASPELLFETSDAKHIQTVALAGTRPVVRADELLTDPKEQREHEFVVRDIVARLRSRGEIRVEPTECVRYPQIAHLRTQIRLTLNEAVPHLFGELVKDLHPTAALGAWPRNGAGWNWLKKADRTVAREEFGAPFGFEDPNGLGVCLVAIRQVRWKGTHLEVGAGSGVLGASHCENEWRELRNKRRQVKGLFGLPLAERGSAL